MKNDILYRQIAVKENDYLFFHTFKTSKNRSGTIDGSQLYTRNIRDHCLNQETEIFFKNGSPSLYFLNFSTSDFDYSLIVPKTDYVFTDSKIDIDESINLAWFSLNNFKYYILNSEGEKEEIEVCNEWYYNKDLRDKKKEEFPNKIFVLELGFNAISRAVLLEKFDLEFDKEMYVYEVGTIQELEDFLK